MIYEMICNVLSSNGEGGIHQLCGSASLVYQMWYAVRILYKKCAYFLK